MAPVSLHWWHLGGGNSNMFVIFTPKILGKWSNLTFNQYFSSRWVQPPTNRWQRPILWWSRHKSSKYGQVPRGFYENRQRIRSAYEVREKVLQQREDGADAEQWGEKSPWNLTAGSWESSPLKRRFRQKKIHHFSTLGGGATVLSMNNPGGPP